MSTHVARRRAAAAVTALAVTAGSLVAGGFTAAQAAERTAATSVDTTYLQDTLGLPTNTVVETVTYDRFQWLLQQPGQFAFVVGSPSDDFKTKIQAADAAARAANVSRLYWFDPNLSGYTGTKNLDTRNPSGITSIATASQTIYGYTWKNVLAQYLGNGLKATGAGTGTITTAPDDSVVNDAVGPIWDYRSTPAAPPIGNADNVLFVYDKDRTSGGQVDKIAGSVNLTTDADAAASVASLLTAVDASTLDRIDQFHWWKSENNRRLAAAGDSVRYGSTVLEDADAANGWNVQQLTYSELIHLLEIKDSASKNFVILFGGTWCPNTRAVIKHVNEQAVANDVTVYNFDTILDGGVVGGGTTSANNPIQVRNNAAYASGGVTTSNYVPSYLYGDLVRRYLRNITTEYDPNTGTRVLFYPGGDVTATPDVVRRLQVPFLVNYQRGTATNPSGSAIKRQWIQQNTDASTGLPTFREYMSQYWFTNPEGTRIGLSTTQLPLELSIPENPAAAPDTAYLTAAEQATATTEEKATLVAQRRSSVTSAVANREFGQEALRALRTFFGGLPGAVVSSPTVTAPTVAFGTAATVNLAIANTYGRVPTGPATLSIAGATYTQSVANNAAQYTLPVLAPGTYPYTVSYTGDTQILGFTAPGSLVVTEAKADSTIDVTGDSVAFGEGGTVSVDIDWVGGVAPTGEVTLSGIGTTQTATLTSGTATFTISDELAVDDYAGTITYAGDANYFGSAAPVTYTVAEASASISAPARTVAFGSGGTFAATVSSASGVVPTGQLTLTGVGATQTKALVNGTVTFTLPKALAAKAYTATLAYGGDSSHSGTSSTSKYTVAKSLPSSVKYVTNTRPTSTATGKATVTVNGLPGVARPTGKVVITLRSGKSVRTVAATLSNGQRAVVLPKLAKGKWSVVAAYAGDTNFLPRSITSSITVLR
jgi:hypothetical protein